MAYDGLVTVRQVSGRFVLQLKEPLYPIDITFNCTYTLDELPAGDAKVRVLQSGTLNPSPHTDLTYDVFTNVVVHVFSIPLGLKEITLTAPLDNLLETAFTYRSFTFSLSA